MSLLSDMNAMLQVPETAAVQTTQRFGEGATVEAQVCRVQLLFLVKRAGRTKEELVAAITAGMSDSEKPLEDMLSASSCRAKNSSIFMA